MHLSDCFTELMAYTMRIIPFLESGNEPYDTIRDTIEKKILTARKFSETKIFDSVDYELAEFAVLSWIDEKILQTQWESKKIWQKNKLQLKYYKTAFGGSEFYKRLDSLDHDQGGVREVYYICLITGFHGQYCLDEDKDERERIIKLNLKRLTGTSDSRNFIGDKKLLNFSDNTLNDNATPGAPQKKKYLLSFIGFTLPVFFLLLLFMVYRFVLNNEVVTRLVY
jgi:type VI secretion system protein ImpK